MISVAICDDDSRYIKIIFSLINKYKKDNEIKVIAFNDGQKLYNSIKNGNSFDIIIMDIELKNNLNGMQVALKIKNIVFNSLIIYISGFDKYYLDLLQAEPFAFISKPINEKLFDNALSKSIERIKLIKNKYFYYKVQGIINRVNLYEVIYFLSNYRVINIITKDKKTIEFYGKLDDVEEKINKLFPYFIRTNKSYLVNFNYITSFAKESIHIDNEEITITRNYSKHVIEKRLQLLNDAV